ncbi:MAG: phosphatase PAP2 family protein [Bythopirellula sp.]|nr:phosphatase PAP2 family protein [Bythopirellula sp.]
MPESDTDFRKLLNRTLAAIIAGGFAVTLCYFFVDRQVAFYVNNHGINKITAFKWLTYSPPLVQTWSPVVIALLAVRRAFGPWKNWQHVLFVACVSLIIADQFRYSIGDAAGRYWPETWHDDNPSLIGNGTYGFHLFHADDDEGSFPSGHAGRIVGFLGVFWLALPRGRWLYVLLALPMLVALVAMNYHFVGDVVAGSVLGAIVAAWGVKLGKQASNAS